MQEKSKQIPSADEVKQFAQSDIGRQLLTYFQTNDSPELQSAMKKAAKGDYSQAKKIINELLTAPGAPDISKQR